ncbi:MAG: hypothetical protein LBJ46_11875, partial [Planctomycetota bacterium]|nr:hypothetical protein [Planctomycetota bacterium]
ARQLASAAEGSLGAALKLADGNTLELWRWLTTEAFASPGAPAARRLAERLDEFGGGDNAGKRAGAIAALDLAALAVRRLLRNGLGPRKGAKALLTLWEAAERIRLNVSPDLVLASAAYAVMAAIKA